MVNVYFMNRKLNLRLSLTFYIPICTKFSFSYLHEFRSKNSCESFRCLLLQVVFHIYKLAYLLTLFIYLFIKISGEAEAIRARAQATAEGIAVVSKALKAHGGVEVNIFSHSHFLLSITFLLSIKTWTILY